METGFADAIVLEQVILDWGGPRSCDWCPCEKRDMQTHRDTEAPLGEGRGEAEVGAMHLQDQECGETGRDEADTPPQSLCTGIGYHHLGLRLVAPSAARKSGPAV